MKNFIIVSSALVGILLMGPLVREATADPPLTGTWSGTATCTGVVADSLKDPEDVPITIAISTVANPVNLNLDVTLTTGDFGPLLNGPPAQRYHGKSNGNGKAGKISQCGTTFGPKRSFTGVIGDVKVLTKKNVPSPFLTGKLLALDDVLDPDDAVACVFDHVVRTSATDPLVDDSCPP
ncbi:MAG: hypothetical protein HY268_08150 [Deltaproteobacteria bacterium]|nr:hypothetical protein [Deltaproteobacteria bacterium]